MTQHAFTSTVFKQVEPGWYLVRSRDHDSLGYLCELAGLDESRIYSDWPSDYAYRIKVSKEEMMRYLEAELDAVDYPNFKSRAQKTRGKTYHDALAKCWGSLLALTPGSVRQAMHRSWDDYDREHGYGRYAKLSKSGAGSGKAGAASGGTAGARWADANWWYDHFPQQHDTLAADSDFTDLEADALVAEVDELFRTKSVHDLTEDEWRALMEENPGGI